ncbi:MAG TPA: OmpH family outer membrane protein [Rhodothermales bacterium]|nr:OmpH family outer membrane protein [Rhodothermales bacterium]
MIKRIFGLAMLGLLLLPTMAVQAQSLKVGYTDHEVLILNMPEYQTVQQTLQQEYQGSQSELQTAYTDYQAQVERYQKQQALLSEEKRQEREQELMAAQQDLQQRAAQKDEALSNREVELMGPIFNKVDAAIRAVAQEKGLDIVLRSQAGPSQPIILYVNEDKITDITTDVARRLGLDVGDQASN